LVGGSRKKQRLKKDSRHLAVPAAIGDIEQVKSLIEFGAQVNEADPLFKRTGTVSIEADPLFQPLLHFLTALHEACFHGHCKSITTIQNKSSVLFSLDNVVQLLLEHDANDTPDSSHQCALHHAAGKRNTMFVFLRFVIDR
jgi:ankyrin repeat protein